MSTPSRRRFPLHLHLSTLFLPLVLATGLGIAFLSYQRSSAMVETATNELFRRVAQQTNAELQILLSPQGIAAGLLDAQRIAGAESLPDRLRALQTFRDALSQTPAITSFFIGYASGDFFLVRRAWDEQDRRVLGAPPQTAYVVQSVERRADGSVFAQHLFFDDQLMRLGAAERSDLAAFDPRRRGWYTQALGADQIIRTPAYRFATTGRVGITLARRVEGTGTVVGADMRLETLGDLLRRNKQTPNAQLAIVGPEGRVAAYENMEKVLGAGLGQSAAVAGARLQEFDVPALAALGRQWPDLGKAIPPDEAVALVQFEVDGSHWHGAIAKVAYMHGATAHLVLAVSEDEILAEARKALRDAVLSTFGILLLVTPIVLLVSRIVARALRRLVGEAQAIQRFEFSQPIAVTSIVKEIDDVARTMDGMKRTIRRFLDISTAVAAEDDFERLLRRLLDESIATTRARGGAIWLPGQDAQRFEAAAARSVGGADIAARLPGVPAEQLRAIAGDPSRGVQPRTGVATRDAHATPFDQALCAALDIPSLPYVALPLANRSHELLGVMVLWLDEPPDAALVAFIAALSGTAAVSLETRDLIRAQKALFEAFIRLIAGAIDAKSPYTGGHCERVPELTKLLARAACDSADAPFRDFSLTAQDWETVHIASWLHDCGKVTTPEYVVDKATKLETIYDRIHEIRMRVEVLKRDAEIDYWRKIAGGADATALRGALDAELAQLDDDFRFIAQCNEGGEFMAPERIERLRRIGARTWQRTLDDRVGISQEERRRKAGTPEAALPARETLLADRPEHVFPRVAHARITEDNPWGFRIPVPEHLYNRGELYNLSIGRGTLTEEERYKINEHIVQTIIMLSALPFPRHLRQVPEIAGGHHEKMDGTGYPRRLTGAGMSALARMMAIADVFEALTAADRPYKKGKTLSAALGIMAAMTKDRHLDPDLFRLFVSAGVYRRYAEQFLSPEQVDAVDESQVLARAA